VPDAAPLPPVPVKVTLNEEDADSEEELKSLEKSRTNSITDAMTLTHRYSPTAKNL